MTEYLWCRKRRIAALMLIAGLAGPSMEAALADDSTSEPQQRIVACVNGIAISEQALIAAIAAAGEPDTPALRVQFKHRLIAHELLRQAAAQAPEFSECAAADVRGGRARHHALSPCAEHVVGRYLRTILRPEAATDAQVHTRYAEFAGKHGGELPGPSVTPGFACIAETLRKRIETERFEQRLQRFVDELMRADIRVSG